MAACFCADRLALLAGPGAGSGANSTLDQEFFRSAFHVGIKNGKSQFYLGEVIALELTFTTKMPKRYQINMARYDRSGRMSYEQFLVNPDGGWGDPLRSYFNSSMGWMGGGLTGFEFLSESPTKISLELNEWVQFHRAGKYRVTVQTSRVGEISGEASSPFDKPVSASIASFCCCSVLKLMLRLLVAHQSARSNSYRFALVALYDVEETVTGDKAEVPA
jgi:hypothetical protein